MPNKARGPGTRARAFVAEMMARIPALWFQARPMTTRTKLCRYTEKRSVDAAPVSIAFLMGRYTACYYNCYPYCYHYYNRRSWERCVRARFYVCDLHSSKALSPLPCFERYWAYLRGSQFGPQKESVQGCCGGTKRF